MSSPSSQASRSDVADLLAGHVRRLYRLLGVVRTRRVLHAGAWTLDRIACGIPVRPHVRERVWRRLLEFHAGPQASAPRITAPTPGARKETGP